MDKAVLISKVEKLQTIDKKQLLEWLRHLPPTSAKVTPLTYKVGDVFMHHAFNHPYILLKKRGNFWLCTMLTTEETCKEILEPCQSRFFAKSYFTQILFTVQEPLTGFMGVYENKNHLAKVLRNLTELICLGK